MGVDSAVSIRKQVTKDIDLKEDNVRCYKTEHSKILKRNDKKAPSSFTRTNASGLLFKMNFKKQSVVEIFQLSGYCGVYIL